MIIAVRARARAAACNGTVLYTVQHPGARAGTETKDISGHQHHRNRLCAVDRLK